MKECVGNHGFVPVLAIAVGRLAPVNECMMLGSLVGDLNVRVWGVVTSSSAAAHAQWRTDRQRREHVTLEAGEDIGRVLRRPPWQHMRVPPPTEVFERALLQVFGRSVEARILAAAELLARLVAGGACLVERHLGPAADRQQRLYYRRGKTTSATSVDRSALCRGAGSQRR